MRHKDIEYRVIQGIKRGTWRWSADLAGVNTAGRKRAVKGSGTEFTRDKAIARAVQAIDRALSEPKLRLKSPSKYIETTKL